MLSLDGDTSWDGVNSNRVATGGASVSDNANNWILFDNDVCPYVGSYNHSVDSGGGLDLITRYEPNAIIVGTTLPDREGTQNGVITWGSNPAGVSVTLSSFVSSGQPTFAPQDLETRRDVLQPVRGSWVGDMDVAGLQTTPFYPIVEALSSTGGLTDFSEEQVWMFFGMALVVLLTLAGIKFFGSHIFLVGIFCALGIILCTLYYNIFPDWSFAVAGAVIIASLVMERSPTL